MVENKVWRRDNYAPIRENNGNTHKARYKSTYSHIKGIKSTHFLQISAAKVRLFFDITKFLVKKKHTATFNL